MLLAVKEIGRFYVYALVDTRKGKDNGRVFYVGKGKGERTKVHLRQVLKGYHRNKKLSHKINQILKAGKTYDVEFLFSSENENLCLEQEKRWIEFYGKKTLCNYTEGGEGSSGYRWTASQRERRRMTHPSTIRITVDEITSSVFETCKRVGINMSVFRKWFFLGHDPQEIVNRWRIREPNNRSIFREDTKSTVQASVLSGKKRSILIKVDGITDSIRSTCRRLDISVRNFRSYLNKGVDPQTIADNWRHKLLNKRPTLRPPDGFKGVSYDPDREKWMAYIHVGGKMLNLGRFSDVTDAGRAYNLASIKYRGPTSHQNCIPD